ncbi:MAG: ABC transporter permease [Ignavibacteria bacterium]|nr:ABC transporter permease [Ignavibacteria bacterium]
MKNNLRKNRILLRSFFSLIILFSIWNIAELISGFHLVGLFILELFSDFGSFKRELDVHTLDFLFAVVVTSIFLMMSVLGLLYFYVPGTRVPILWKFFNWSERLSFQILLGSFLIAALIFTAINSPIISTHEPNYYKDIIVTKLLPPGSKIHYVERTIENNSANKLTSIQNLKKNVMHQIQDESKLFITSFNISGDQLIYLQGFRKYTEPISHFKIDGTGLIINEKIFYLGSDDFGRDVFSRLIYSTRMSLMIGLLSVLVSLLLGGLIGYSAGFYGGVLDTILMRIVDFFFSVPILFLIVFLIAMFGNSLFLLILALGLGGWMSIARLARAETISCKKKEFIESLKLTGQTNYKILTKHILPNTISPLIVALVLQFGNVIMAESALSFLGLGVQPPTPTWGSIIKSGYDFISSAWWLTTFGGLAIVISVLSFNLLAEGMISRLNPTKH